ncbi:MAG TPA: cytochrome c oxidase subunit II [Gemmataceae bacterium]|nr:cytochrome c oxidase subunit II [Gemmataceae bacterium]
MIGPLLLAVSEGSPQNLSIFDPVSPPAESIHYLSILVLTITGGIFVVVESVLIYSLLRFRHAKVTDASEPPQVYGSKPIEIAWTAAPALIVFVLTLVIARTEWEVRVDPNKPSPDIKDGKPLRVTVVGHQWWWEFNYEKYGDEQLDFVTANELHVPASNRQVPTARRPVFLKLESADVAHSFWVPRLAGKTDLIPGKTNSMWFETERTGLLVGQCAEYCGTQHANMLLRVYVDSPAEFENWLKNQQKDARDSDDAAVRKGKEAFLALSCISCHRVRGTPARGTVGPDLTHLMSRDTLAGGMISNDREGENLRHWIDNPHDIKPGCLMNPFGQSERDRERVDRVVRYLASLE